MFFKLSSKNVKKSFKNYTLYFLTLTFGVCIFYIFNSIEAQKSMMSISQSTSQIMETLTELMNIISVFISIILGFLIVYANNFLIRRRKKEIGIYMTLGMEKGKVSRILVAENFIIGILSLAIGLLAGVFLSQGLAVITAKLFEVDMTEYHFIFSSSAFIKTILYFGIIFLVVMFMSTISISKYKLIELIKAEKQNEKQKLKNPVLTVILFILSIACIGTAYKLVLKNGIGNFDKKLIFEIVLGSIGTFLFFASLSGFFLKLLQSRKKLYFKKLNMFILRQINSKINTAHISMSIICLMLFCTIGILSTGLGINSVLNKAFNDVIPFDASFVAQGGESIVKKLKQYNLDFNKYSDKLVEYSLYNYKNGEINNKVIFEKMKGYESKRPINMKTPILFMRITDYNKLLKLGGKEEIRLSENEVALYSPDLKNETELKDALYKYIKSDNTIKIGEKQYSIYSKALTFGFESNMSPSTIMLVVPDKITEGAVKQSTIVSFNCKGDSKLMQKKLEDDLYSLTEKTKNAKNEIKISGMTKEAYKAIGAGTEAVIAFVGIYIGIIFLITSAAILALQQLSEAADNRHRYDILEKIGADDKLVKATLFKQIAIYFMLPIILACIHSVVGIKVANDMIREGGNINATSNIIITAVFITIVYGAYFLATYFSSKRIVLRRK